MSNKEPLHEIQKLATGIPGFDAIAEGGLPLGRTTVVKGVAGSAKSLFAIQFVCCGLVEYSQNAVFVCFEESPKDIKRNVLSLDWDLHSYDEKENVIFLDYSPNPKVARLGYEDFDFENFLSKIKDAVVKTNAERVVIDSLEHIFSGNEDTGFKRHNLLLITQGLKEMGVTSVITAEENNMSSIGIPAEYVADCVVQLSNNAEGEKRRRTVEVLKMRGAIHQKGQFPFTISNKGLEAMPLSMMELTHRSSNVRLSLGRADIDEMCGGGVFRDSVILVSGATGTGKTLASTTFADDGCYSGERVIIFAFEESREQLLRNAIGWGKEFSEWESAGLLKVVCLYPEVLGLEDHLLLIKQEVESFQPSRICVDSLSALERIGSVKSFREFVIGLTSFIKEKQVCGMVTATTPNLLGGTSVTEAHISTITDTIILLRYVEMMGSMHRGMTVLKMRGSTHDKSIREYTIDENGMKMGAPFSMFGGILAGNPIQFSREEGEKMLHMFDSRNDRS